MPDTTDRLEGARSTFGVKKPVVAATTGSITLSGEQTIDGIACTEDDRVLVKDQADETTNGIYSVATSAWARTKDFDGITDWCKGTLVVVASGTVNAGKIYRVTSADPDDLESDITFESISFADAHSNDSIIAAATLNLNSVEADAIDVTGGGATITAITLTEGLSRLVRFTGANTLTHGASLVLPGALNITTASGDFALFRGYASGVVRCAFYQRGDGEDLVVGNSTIASAATVDLGAVRSQAITISGTTPVASFGTSAVTGVVKFVRLSGAVPFTNGANLVLPGGQDIQGYSGDSFIASYEGSSVWRVLNYTRAAAQTHGDATDVSNSAVTESDLMSYTLPAGRLAHNGAGLQIEAWGVTTTATTAANRRMRLYFGATAIADSGAIALVGGTWRLQATVLRDGAGSQEALGTATFSTGAAGVAGSSMTLLRGSLSETVSSTLAIKVTGLCTASSGIITQHGFVVRQLSV
jgi:hypothetical protein